MGFALPVSIVCLTRSVCPNLPSGPTKISWNSISNALRDSCCSFINVSEALSSNDCKCCGT